MLGTNEKEDSKMEKEFDFWQDHSERFLVMANLWEKKIKMENVYEKFKNDIIVNFYCFINYFYVFIYNLWMEIRMFKIDLFLFFFHIFKLKLSPFLNILF